MIEKIKPLTDFEREEKFTFQHKLFISRSLELFGVSNLNDLPKNLNIEPIPLIPVIVKNYMKITNEEKANLKKNYISNNGAVYFYIENHVDTNQLNLHPLLVMANQLKKEFQFEFPLDYPYDYDSDTKLKFGKPDGTTKIYESTIKKDSLALTNESMTPHQDGMGLGGSVGIVALYCDSHPLFGGITFIQNIIKIGLQLLKKDEEAFCSLFYPNAITYIRKNERKGIKIVSPILYLNNFGEPTFNLKFSDSLHDVFYRSDKALARAIDYFLKYTKPLSYGSSFVQFTNQGLGCFINNLHNVHGRTSFLNGKKENQKRILSRKWFATSKEYTEYQFFPGILILKEYADLYPEFFKDTFLKGFWNYNLTTLENEINNNIKSIK